MAQPLTRLRRVNPSNVLTLLQFTVLTEFILMGNLLDCEVAHPLGRSKSANDWNFRDLKAYNIRIVYQDSATFFGVQDLPPPGVDNDIVNAQEVTNAQHEETFQLLHAMHEAMAAASDDKSIIGDFANHLFRILHYTNMAAGRFLRTRKTLYFFSCSEERDMEIDACIMEDIELEGTEIVLLIQGDKRDIDSCASEPGPQLIAHAIAAFSMNNDTIMQNHSANPLSSKVMPGITMTHTAPTFYKIPVTCDLEHAVYLGIHPLQETVVFAHRPVVPRYGYGAGMKPLDNRGIILSCYEAFKQFI